MCPTPTNNVETNMNEYLPTENEEWGFFGTIATHADAQTAWQIALRTIAEKTNEPAESVRAFLDSTSGRQFADDVANALLQTSGLADAIEKTARRWMAWTISKRTSKHYGIPEGLPYLTGFVIHHAIETEV